ncbi:MAG: phosphoserine phosphatase RsbU/P [Acidobacteriaceae bacterium]|jgi:sigma-B regulation protein RsbU (phosphoserine phosphatase)|nr:phosphoserine phosphatase RsbU/P [Acidobacteriaceae bacterium]
MTPPRDQDDVEAGKKPAQTLATQSFEGDYRPSSEALPLPGSIKVDPLQTEFLMRLANALNTTLDLQTLLHRTADLVRAVIDYKIFAILLLNERTNDLRMRFQIGHTPEVERLRIRVGKGVVGRAAEHRESVLLQDVTQDDNYISANPGVRSELAVPLIVKNRVIGVIDLQSEQVGYFQPEHRRLLELTASRVAQAIENARLYTRVARQAQTLAVLNEISREVTSILDLDPLLERIGELLRRIIDYQMFSILLVNEREQVLEIQYAVRFGHPVAPSETVPLDRGLVGTAVRERRLIYSGDVRKDARYYMVNPETRSEMAVPLLYKGKVIGVLDLEHVKVNYFNEDHQRTLVTLASQIAVAIENARLYSRVAQQEQRLEHDLDMARDVQLRLLPPTPARKPHAEFATRFLPARTIGGDLYDFLPYDDERIGIAMGDVSGKAAPAALYAALISGIMRAATSQALSPAAMLKQLNDSLQERKMDAQYVTMVFAVWNDEKQTLQIANAGAVQPLFCRGGQVETVQAEGFPLGMFKDVSYEEFTLSTRPGDAIIFFSDGIVDAVNDKEEMFGDARLTALVTSHLKSTAQEMVDAIYQELSTFQGGVERFDDETVIVLKVLPGGLG